MDSDRGHRRQTKPQLIRELGIQYTSEGGTNCYWARLNSTGDDIIDNDLASGPAVLTVQASDGLIKTSNCAPFTKTG